VRWRMGHGRTTAKIAIKAAALTGRAGYVWHDAAADRWCLVVRQFQVDPGAEYIDALWDNPAEAGFAFQACKVCGDAERFNELEYHVPGVQATAGANRCVDQSHVWAFRGPRPPIGDIARRLLGAESV
jgi:hypothetical protein